MAKVLDLELEEEQQTDLPELGSDKTSKDRHAGLLDEVAGEAENIPVEETTEPSVEEIKALVEKEQPGATDGLTDEEVLAEWKKANEPEAFKPDFPLYDDKGQPVTDFAKVTLEDFLTGKYTIGYNAMDKEQRKNFSELRRMASNGHYNEAKYTTATSERDQIRQRYQSLDTEHKQWAGERQTWISVLTQAASGNIAPLQKVVDDFAKEAGKLPEPMVEQPEVNRELEEAGQQFILNTVLPTSYDLARKYGHGNPAEIRDVALHLMQQEGEFLTNEKINMILQYELPRLLEEKGYSANGTTAIPQADGNSDPLKSELASLKQQVQELTAKKANDRMASLRGKKAPPAGGGGTQGSGETMPNFKSREDYKKWMRNEE